MKPWLWFSPQFAHDVVAPAALHLLGHWPQKAIPEWKSFHWRGLEFPNRLGIAGGVDKNAEYIKAFWNLGTGFIEIGTVTPKSQSANPGKVLDRDIETFSLWNRMGFPSRGSEFVLQNLQKIKRPHRTPIFVNIGKNRETSLENAAQDYVALVDKFKFHADAFVVNVSSPNTPGLRDLQNPIHLKNLLLPIVAHSKRDREVPILVKLSPDLSSSDLKATMEACLEVDIDGFVLTNTTLSSHRPARFPSEGGVSGGPLTQLSRQILVQARDLLNQFHKEKLLISAGGILTPEEIKMRLDLGADLVQVYSAFIFNGPAFFRTTAKVMLS